ncbi:MAG: hypothetical protein NZ742_11035 [Acidobacteria bacterium]|nr:hypothetical protein [Acidobacteriota bacterium]MDW7985234.1 c-type cytochrome domain-containing protein [Acidobacteriota bacterium]
MRLWHPLGTLCWILALTILGAACSTGGDGETPLDRCAGMAPDRPSYAMHVQPLFNANCAFSGCHTLPNPQRGLDLGSYQGLMQGSINGPVVIPGNAQDSRLVKRIEGRETPRMPPNRDPLCQFQIDTIRRWIDQGALNN